MVGLNPAGSSPFADSGATPDGMNVAFIQSLSSYLRFFSLETTARLPRHSRQSQVSLGHSCDFYP
jgi:hypothetical protein